LCDNYRAKFFFFYHHTHPGSPQMEDNRKKALAAALGQIEKQFG